MMTLIKSPLEISILTCVRKKKWTSKNRWLFAETTFTKALTSTRQVMNDPITTFEIPDPFKKMKTGKAPGPDELSSQYYKCFKEQFL